MKIRRTKSVAFWGLSLAMLFAYGCPSNQGDQKDPATLQAKVKAAGQTINVAKRSPQPPATVAIIRDNSLNYATMMSQALEAALGPGGIANLVHSGDTVVIKPNVVTGKTAAAVDWHVIKALVDQIKTVNGGASITIAEASASQDSIANMNTVGINATNIPGVSFANLNDTGTNPTNTYVLADARTGANKQIAALISEAAVYIDMPKMKTHYHAGYTGALKNLGIGSGPLPLWNSGGNFGAGGSAKYGLHHDIRSEIVDHVACRVPDLSIMDAIQGMEGQGPASGTSVTMNMVLASKDPVALDAIATNIMGIPSYLIAHMVLAANENIGVIDLSNITVAGNITLAAASAIHPFTRATPGNAQAPIEPGIIPYRATTVIRTAPTTMTIDGDLSEWGYANAMTVDTSAQVKSASGWGGASDASVRALTMYDAQNLYVAMLVKDNTKLTNSNTGAAVVNGDGVELYLSTVVEQYNTTARSYGSTNDYHLGISYANPPQAYMLSHSKALTGATISKVDTSDGYVIEASIPWSNFGSPTITPLAMAAGFVQYRQLGFNVALNDADTSVSTVDHKLLWNAATDSDVETNAVKTGMSYVDPAGGLYGTPTYTLTTSATNGSVTKSPDADSYSANRVVTLTAVPSAGYVFTGWSGDAAGTTNPLSVSMLANKSITANFAVGGTLTTITVSPSSGSVATGQTRQFTAIAYDQNGNQLSPQPAFTWTVPTGAGNISASGLFTAGSTAGGPYTVTAASGTIIGTATVTVTAAPTTVYQINCGSSSAASPFAADQYGSGGTQRSVTNTISLTGVTNPAPAAVYQSERYGASTYTFPNLTAGSQYTVRLHFAELYQTATGKRVFNVAINGTAVLSNFDLYATAGANYKAVVREFTATANTTGQIVVALTTVTDNATISGIELLALSTNTAPTIATAASATPTPVTGTSTALSVLGADDAGEENLTYTWATLGTPPAAVTFSANGSNAAKSATATFTKAGNYTLQVTVADQAGLSATSTVSFTVDQTVTTLVVTPASATVAPLGSQQFAASARDQFGSALATQPSITWTANSGTVDNTGLFTAGPSVGGPFTVTATSDDFNGTATVTVAMPNLAPTIVTAAAADPTSVTATSTALSVLGDDDAGEPSLTYTWTTVGTPPAAVSFSANGSNAAKSTTATFTAAGSYTLQVTVTDQQGLSVTSQVAVTVSQTVTSIVVSPSSASINTSATQQFTATARDQFGTTLTTQPTFTWTASDGRTISASGLFSAGTTAGGPFTVTASSGAVSATASVTVTAAPTTIYQINCGGSAASPFTADQYATGGTQRTVTNTITISGITKPAPAAVYQAERYGNSTYTLPNLTPGSQYQVRLHFAELYQTATGKRVFNVAINGTAVLSNFDIYAVAGANYKAVLREFTTTANTSGQIVVALTTVTDNATISGIEIIALTPNNPPAIATPATATPNPVSSTTAALSALGDDDGGEASLTYTWATTGTPPAAVTFSANGTNAAKNTVATFGKAGTYTLQVTVKDAPGLTTTSQVAVTVDQTLTSIVVAPTTSSVDIYGMQQFAATGRDQFATALTAQPSFDWTVSGGGIIDATGLFTAGASGGGPYTVTASSGGVSGIATVSVTVPNAAPTISTPAAATPDPVVGTTAALSVQGDDDAGETGLTYTWATTGTPPAGVAFSVNGTNAAQNTTATFTKAGSYSFQVTVRDQPGLTATSTVTVTVSQTLSNVVVSPSNATVNVSTTQQFTAVASDQFAAAMASQPTFAWTVSGGGTVSSTGLFTAGSTDGGPFAVTATAGISGTASVTVTVPNAPPTIATAAAASPSPVTGTTTALSVLGADDGGEANLTYTWATTGTPPATVSFSANGTNAAKSTTATFTKAGSYSFQVTVKDQSALTATSSFTVVVSQTLTSIVLSPSTASVATSATQQFIATARDQFATNLTTPPTFTWSLGSSSAGSISTAGLFTAGTTAGGPYTVTAASGGKSGTASVTVTGGSTPCAGLCTSPVVFTSKSYQSGNLGTGATCHETTAALAGGNCSNLSSRTIKVNNTTVSCNGWTLPAKLNGGYCIQVSAGTPSYTSFATW
jgi:uncharacterized repeat protein (TIGR02543 family)